ncbi:MAG: hypothetical protein KZQ92_20500 [Candidatus Thiodiazotropha sp. (ex Lucinoma borealis)]|nr:hypothetical protein [Candidatus Thiodiazotropha sp. (ex Lucinoma borealis)]MCU7866344.1 hypothetical protein [Candidatus Thiodiazotropha sp. (ex Lucinoma borealis)]
MKVPHRANTSVSFSYDYDLLSRSLLKIAYNTARSAGSEVGPFKPLVEYILRGGDQPQGFALAIELVSPSYIEGKSGILQEVPPIMYRSARGELQTENGSAVHIRVVAVFSFFFHLLLLRSPDEFERFGKAIKEFLAGIKGTVLLKSNEDMVLIRSSPQNSLNSMLPLLRGKREEYGEFFRKKRRTTNNDT